MKAVSRTTIRPLYNCCVPGLYAWFTRERLARVGLRHCGPFCAGQLDIVKTMKWFTAGEYVPTGEVLYLG